MSRSCFCSIFSCSKLIFKFISISSSSFSSFFSIFELSLLFISSWFKVSSLPLFKLLESIISLLFISSVDSSILFNSLSETFSIWYGSGLILESISSVSSLKIASSYFSFIILFISNIEIPLFLNPPSILLYLLFKLLRLFISLIFVSLIISSSLSSLKSSFIESLLSLVFRSFLSSNSLLSIILLSFSLFSLSLIELIIFWWFSAFIFDFSLFPFELPRAFCLFLVEIILLKRTKSLFKNSIKSFNFSSKVFDGHNWIGKRLNFKFSFKLYIIA